MRLVLVLTLSACLAGCIASNTVVRSQAMSFDDIIEDTTDKLLVLNILRAKDKAPLHFDEIPSIHESVTTTASMQGVWPFGPTNKSVARNTLTASAGVQLAPSFELDNLATKDFVTGMATPIDAKFVKYWLDRGLDRRVVLLLFFSAIDVTLPGSPDGRVERTLRIRNSPREAIDALYLAPQSAAVPAPVSPADFRQGETKTCESQSDFQHYLKLINNLTTFTAQAAPHKKVILDQVSLDNVDLSRVIAAVASLDAAKTSIKYDKSANTLSLFTTAPPRTELCLARTQDGGSGNQSGCAASGTKIDTGADSDDDSSDAGERKIDDVEAYPEFVGADDGRVIDFCSKFGQVIDELHHSGGGPESRPKIRMEIRSVGEIIQFLGDLIAYQDALRAYRASPTGAGDALKLHSILTFGYCGYEGQAPDPHCGDYFFNISSNDDIAGIESSRFSVRYRGKTYFVPRYSQSEQWDVHRTVPCAASDSEPGKDASCIDHTLEVLAVVNQLIDLQRSAQDVQQTPYVSVLP